MRHRLWQKFVIKPPLLLSITFLIPEIFWNTKRLPYDFFRNCATKCWKKNRDKPPLPFSKKLWNQNFSETQNCFRTKLFALWNKQISTDNSEVPLFSVNFSIPDFFWYTEELPYEIFRYCETQTLTKNRDTHRSSPIHQNFRYPKISETQKGSPTKLSGNVRQKLWQKSVIESPLLLSVNIFDFRSFLKHGRVRSPTKVLDSMEQKFNSRKKCYPLLMRKFLHTRHFLEHRRFLLRIVWC